MLAIAQIAGDADFQDVRELIREYTAWAFTLEPGSDKLSAFRGLDQELASLPGIYGPPSGRFLLARYDGKAAGCVALRRHDETTAEVKRLYVRPAFRGHDIGAKLVAALVAAARAAGYRRIVLDSHGTMARAHEVYERAGFRRVPAPAGFPAALKAKVVFMEMDLG